MKKLYFFSAMSICLSLLCNLSESVAQIAVNSTGTPTALQMAQSLIGNTGVGLSNVVLDCPANFYGKFTNANSSGLAINNGIILATGKVNGTGTGGAFPLSNPSGGALGTNFNSTSNYDPGDSWLNTYNVTTQTTHDACILKFDVTPICDTIQFRYIFASEEYPDYANASIADAFAFFIDGPGVPLGTDIARLPASSTPPNAPININTVNNGYMSQSSCDAGTLTSGPCTNCAYYIDNCGGTQFVYDGYTTVLTAMAIVQPCATYHIKLTIADGSDAAFDSGVLLESGTLHCTGFTLNAGTANAIEGCQDGIVQICHQEDSTIAHTVSFSVGGTAVPGIDYVAIPNTVIIPAGTSCTNLLIQAIPNGIPNTVRSVALIYQPNPCTPNDTTWLYIYDPPTPNPSPDVTLCTGIPTTIGTVQQPIFTYNWSPTIGLNSATVEQPTLVLNNNSIVDTVVNYVVSTNAGNCFTLDTIMVTVRPGPVANAGSDITVCTTQIGNIGSLNLPGCTYSWSPTTGLASPNGSNSLFVSAYLGLVTQVTPYIVEVDAGLACITHDTVMVTENPNTIPTLGPYTPVCISAAPFVLTGGAPIGGVYSGTGVAAGSFTPATAGAGSFWIKYTFTNSFGCIASDSSLLVVNPLPQVNAGTYPTICVGMNLPLNASGSANINTWTWTPGTFLSSTNTSNPTFQNPNPAGTYTYTLTVTDANTCVSSTTTQVIVSPLPTLSAGSDVAICIGSSIGLSASGATNYSWTPVDGLDNPLIGNPTANPVITTTYTVMGSSGVSPYICSSTDDIMVRVDPIPTLNFPPLADLCVDAVPLLLNQASPSGGTYSMNSTVISTFDPAEAGTGSHTILYSYSDPVLSTHCSNSITQEILVNPLPQPEFNFSPDHATLANSVISFTDLSPDAASWAWSFGDDDIIASTVQNPNHAYTDTGTYTITLTILNTMGCSQSSTRNVIIGPDMLYYTPTCFTPNGDGQNDLFFGGSGFGFHEFRMIIFDRWGTAVFESQDEKKGWDGNNAQDGTYVYKINLKDFDDKSYEYIGNISVMK